MAEQSKSPVELARGLIRCPSVTPLDAGALDVLERALKRGGFECRRLIFVEDGTPAVAHLLSLTPFRRIVKDYFMICDSYYQAIRTATPDKIEAIDMGRRGIHDEGSRTLQERLKGKVRVDFETARRLFTLITVLHWKG